LKTTTTICEQIKRYIDESGMTINQFAKISGINNGTLSNILNGRRSISIKQLDQMTLALGCSEGHFYEMYTHEYLFPLKPDWRRLGPFLHRCAELNKLDCLDLAARMTLDNTSYLPVLFETAEMLFGEGKYEAAKLLYECVAESEKSQHSERLALCQYRIFMLSLSMSEVSNLQAAVNFESYIDRLDEEYKLDGFKALIDVYLSIHWWDKIPKLADTLECLSTYEYQLNRNKSCPSNKRKKPLIFYRLYAYLIKANYYRNIGDYDKALDYVSLYADPDWVIEPSAEERLIIEKFKGWAIANRFMYKLMNGHFEMLDDYIKYVSSKENEIYTALCNIILAANRFKYDIDWILERYKGFLDYKSQQKVEQIALNSYTRLLAELGIYYLNAKQYERGLAYIVDSFEYSIRIRSDKGMLRCMGLFEQFRSFASPQIQQRYQEMISEVQKLSVYAWMPVV